METDRKRKLTLAAALLAVAGGATWLWNSIRGERGVSAPLNPASDTKGIEPEQDRGPDIPESDQRKPASKPPIQETPEPKPDEKVEAPADQVAAAEADVLEIEVSWRALAAIRLLTEDDINPVGNRKRDPAYFVAFVNLEHEAEYKAAAEAHRDITFSFMDFDTEPVEPSDIIAAEEAVKQAAKKYTSYIPLMPDGSYPKQLQLTVTGVPHPDAPQGVLPIKLLSGGNPVEPPVGSSIQRFNYDSMFEYVHIVCAKMDEGRATPREIEALGGIIRNIQTSFGNSEVFSDLAPSYLVKGGENISAINMQRPIKPGTEIDGFDVVSLSCTERLYDLPGRK